MVFKAAFLLSNAVSGSQIWPPHQTCSGLLKSCKCNVVKSIKRVKFKWAKCLYPVIFTVCPWFKASHLDQVQWLRSKTPRPNRRACSPREGNVCRLMERICTYFAIHFTDISRLEIGILMFIHPHYLLWFEWKMPSTVTNIEYLVSSWWWCLETFAGGSPSLVKSLAGVGGILPFPVFSLCFVLGVKGVNPQLPAPAAMTTTCHPVSPPWQTYPSGIMSPTSSKLHWLWFFITAEKKKEPMHCTKGMMRMTPVRSRSYIWSYLQLF